jgi:hypothetical protein
MKLQLGLVLALAMIGAAVGWHNARRRRRSLYDEKPVGMSDAAYQRLERHRHLFRRLSIAVLYGVIGAAIGWGLSVYLHLS